MLSEEKKPAQAEKQESSGVPDGTFIAMAWKEEHDYPKAFNIHDGTSEAPKQEPVKQEPAYTFHLDETGRAYLKGACVSKEGDSLYIHPHPDLVVENERLKYVGRVKVHNAGNERTPLVGGPID